MISSLSYIIVEDEYFALENLKSIISELRPKWKLAYTSESVEDTVRFYACGGRCDLAFMDIELVDGNCFEIFSKTDIETPVIFTTAYDEYAIRAFKVNSVDYILKPVSQEAAKAAIEKFEKWKTLQEGHTDYRQIAMSLAAFGRGHKRLLISHGDEYTYVDMNDVAYFISEDKYVFAVDFQGKRNMTEYTNLNLLENDIDATKFFQAARNVIVNISAVMQVRKYFNGRLKLIVRNGVSQFQVIVSAARRDMFLEWLRGSAL